MSATVVTTHARTPIADVLESRTIGALSDADHRKRLALIAQPAGQIWERVGERVLNYDVYPWGALDAVERFHDGRGPQVFTPTGPGACGGIIRAGERVK